MREGMASLGVGDTICCVSSKFSGSLQNLEYRAEDATCVLGIDEPRQRLCIL